MSRRAGSPLPEPEAKRTRTSEDATSSAAASTAAAPAAAPAAARRISQTLVDQLNAKYADGAAGRQLADDFRKEHVDNCHHHDWLFLIWHRVFVNKFWRRVGLPRFYALATDPADRALYSRLTWTTTLVADPAGGPPQVRYYEDHNKMNSWLPADDAAARRNITEAMACTIFAMDLDADGRNVDPWTRQYNITLTSQLEEYHDDVHGETGRGMRSVRTAGGDACFFVHHTFVDLAFETWLVDHPGVPFPVDRAHFDLMVRDDPRAMQGVDYDELVRVWGERYYAEDDYKYVRRAAQTPGGRAAITFSEIRHTQSFIRVIIYARDTQQEIARFSIVTGTPDSCVACRTRTHAGLFLLQRLTDPSNMIFRIQQQLFYSWEDAKREFSRLDMGRAMVVAL